MPNSNGANAANAANSDGDEKFMGTFGCRSVNCFVKLNCIGEGTYGTVYRARDKETGQIRALKKLRMKKEKGGFPLTSIREIKILKSINHPNIVNLLEIVVGRKPHSIFLVFEYCEHDLAGLLDRIARSFTEAEIKTIMLQLLQGTEYLHSNFIIHRDLKLSNLLMNNKGVLKMADFGLARLFSNPLKQYTPKVVTLWYRCPELLLGAKSYHTACDMWAVGCIFGELLKHRPLLPGKTELNQLELIFKLLGTPNEKIWPGFSKLSKADTIRAFPVYIYNNLSQQFPQLSANGIDLLSRMLTFDPSKRITAAKALDHPYFSEPPLPASMMPTFPSLHDEPEFNQPSNTANRDSIKLKLSRHQYDSFGQTFDAGTKRRKLG